MRAAPTQKRATERKDAFLEAASHILIEVGYDLLTMKAVAERVDSSIGALYRYFPNKYELVAALHHTYVEEFESDCAPLVALAPSLTIEDLARHLYSTVIQFVERRPAYLAMKAARVSFRRDPARRADLREQIALAFRSRYDSLERSHSLLVATVALQIIHGLLSELSLAKPQLRTKLHKQFETVLRLYLVNAFQEHESIGGNQRA